MKTLSADYSSLFQLLVNIAKDGESWIRDVFIVASPTFQKNNENIT